MDNNLKPQRCKPYAFRRRRLAMVALKNLTATRGFPQWQGLA